MVAGVSLPLLLAVSLAGAASAQGLAASGPDVPSPGILLIAGDDSAQPYVREIYEGFRDVLATAATPTLLYREFFDIVRFGDRPEYAREFRAWLEQKYRDRSIDVLVITMPEALDLLAPPGGALSRARLVYGGFSQGSPDVALHHPEASSAILEDHFPRFLQLVTTVMPGTRGLAVIRGASAAERARDAPYVAAIERQGLAVQDFGGLPMDTILQRVSALRTDTIPVLMGFQVDAAGRTFQADQAVKLIAAATNRPVFSVNPADVGGGAAGVMLFGTRLLGEELAKAALARLAGEGPRRTTIPAHTHASAVFDARQLERWGIAEARLPTASTVLFRQPSLWRDHRRAVIATVAIGSTQTLLIAGILVQRRHRARAQAALAGSYAQLRDLTGRLITAQEEERARIARNLHDDIGQRVASLSIALSGAKRLASSEPLRAELVTIQQATTSLSGELRDLSHDLHPGILEHVGLIEALRSRCDELANTSGANCRLDVSDDWRDVPDSIALCLYRVAQEALRNIERHAGARNVVVSLDRGNGIVTMQVVDDGQGFTTGQKKPGLGLLSLNERVSLLGGEFQVKSLAGAGTTIAVTLPMGVSHAA